MSLDYVSDLGLAVTLGPHDAACLWDGAVSIEKDRKEKMKKSVVRACMESFLHVFLFRELHVYQPIKGFSHFFHYMKGNH